MKSIKLTFKSNDLGQVLLDIATMKGLVDLKIDVSDIPIAPEAAQEIISDTSLYNDNRSLYESEAYKRFKKDERAVWRVDANNRIVLDLDKTLANLGISRAKLPTMATVQGTLEYACRMSLVRLTEWKTRQQRRAARAANGQAGAH